LTANISACIIHNGMDRPFQDTLAAVGGAVDEIIAVDGSPWTLLPEGEGDGSSGTAEASSPLKGDEVIRGAIAGAAGEWILVLKAGEYPAAGDSGKIRDLCRAGGAEVYRFVVHAELDTGGLGAYEWPGNAGKYSRAEVVRSGYIPLVGIRLFRKSALARVSSFERGVPQFANLDGMPVRTCWDIRILTADGGEEGPQTLGEEERWQRDRERFLRGIAPQPELTDPAEGLESIGPGRIGYALVSAEDLSSLEAGLDHGFGRVDILKWAVYNLIEAGDYESAVRFADKIISRLPEVPEIFQIWHLKGVASFHMLDLANAERAMRRALDLNGADRCILSDLARVYIVAGKPAEAISVLESATARGGLMPENEYLSHALKQGNTRPAKISLLILCRDEEEYIGRALQSARSIFDEIVAVDTGSRDGTGEILRAHGATVFPVPWADDFAAARNFGLTKVSGDYVFWMDADEFLTDKDRLSLLVFKNLLPPEGKIGVVFDVETLNGDYDLNAKGIPPMAVTRRTRLFPNRAGVRFRGRVFETVDASLKTLHIQFVLAESISLRHHHRNDAFRRRRIAPAMERSIADLDCEELLRGVQFWLEGGDAPEAVEWFERAIEDCAGDDRHLSAIVKLFDEFKRRGLIQSRPRIFRKLLTTYADSYRIATLCADYLYELNEYDGAMTLLKRLVGAGDARFADEPEIADIRKNRLTLALVSIERDDFETCDAMRAVLSGDGETADAARAVSVYEAMRMRDLDAAIGLLDRWIRERHMPVKGTIASFADLLLLLAEIADIVKGYGSLDASAILARSAEYLAATLTKAG
jgi:glycosyltransferase involved in cell wall biosynthesis